MIKKLQQIGTVLKLCKALLSSNVLEKEIQDDSERGGGGGGGGNSEFEESLHLLNTSDSHCLDKTTKALFKMFLTKPNNVFFLVHTQPGTSEVTVSLKSYSRLCYALVCEISACYIKH